MGDLLHVQSFRTWEFTSVEPIRSIAFPYAVVGIPAMILHIIGVSLSLNTSVSYLLLVLPRLVMCCLSVVHDICLIKICKIAKENYIHRLLIFASSYVTCTFSTRTLSNSMEAVLFTLLIYIVCKDVHKASLCYKRTNITENCVSRNYLLGVLVVVGFFIRPTFLLFAFAPVMFWVKSSGILSGIVSLIRNIMWFLPGVFTTAVCLIFIDSMYYYNFFLWNMPLNSIFNILERLVVTPLNFIKYNLDFAKIKSHGDHPRYLHFLVNLHMLFPVLGLCGLVHVFRLLKHFRSSRWTCIERLMIISFISPLVLLSVIPHQEPRFITPVLFPLVYVSAQDIFSCGRYNIFGMLWFLGNALGIMFFGFVHQGGLVSALTSLSLELSKQSMQFEATHIVFYHTYMPPRYLMAVPNVRENVYVHDLLGTTEEVLFSEVYDVINNSLSSSELLIVSPGTLHSSFKKLNLSVCPSAKIDVIRKFFPHYSSEDPPDMSEIVEHLRNNYSFNYQHVIDMFSLILYKVDVFR